MVFTKVPTGARAGAAPTIALLFVFQATPFTLMARSPEPDARGMPGMAHDMVTHEPPGDTETAARRLADKRESEFNHHLAGFFVVLAGIFVLAEGRLAKRWPLARYVWPMCFLATGLFLLVFSDTEIWPFGPQTPWYAVTHNPEDLQHKVFAIILLAVGYVGLQRARERIKSPWVAWFFPIVAAVGAVLLLFHVHSGDMEAPHAMEAMEHIQQQHRWFAGTGLGVALTSWLAEMPRNWRTVFKFVWLALLVVLGVLLMRSTE
jgi:copper resistance protein D